MHIGTDITWIVFLPHPFLLFDTIFRKVYKSVVSQLNKCLSSLSPLSTFSKVNIFQPRAVAITFHFVKVTRQSKKVFVAGNLHTQSGHGLLIRKIVRLVLHFYACVVLTVFRVYNKNNDWFQG